MDWLDAYATPELAERFRGRIGFDPTERLDRAGLDAFLVAAGRSIPFENLALTDPAHPRVDPETLVAKILDRWEGGLCYEINPLLALALRAEGFDARVVRGTIADPDTGGWFPLSRTHVTVLLPVDGGLFLADAGFGVKQPLGLVPVGDEDGVRTPHGRYRVVGGVLGAEWMLQLDPDGSGWVNAYGFTARDEVTDPGALDVIRDLIARRPESVFNRGLLVALPTERGRLVLGRSGLTEVRDGRRSVLALAPDEVSTVSRLFFRRFVTA